MKPFRTTVVLLVLLVLPLFASQALANFYSDTVNVCDYETKISANTDDQVVLGFTIPEDGDTLKSLKVRSWIERSFATDRVKLWKETSDPSGFDASDDSLVQTINTYSIPFQTHDVITFSGIDCAITGTDTFYITVSAHTDSVKANADSFHNTGLEVTIDSAFCVLNAGAGDYNLNHVHNKGWVDGATPYFWIYRLIFDTKGPSFDLHFCMEDSTCSTFAYYDIEPYIRVLMVDHEDSVRICATNVESDIDSSYGIRIIGNVHLLGYVSSQHMFGVSNVRLNCPDAESYGCSGTCDSCWTTGFRIPDVNNSSFKGVDADTGHWAICAYARDKAGNVDTVCLAHDELPYRIDTQDPIIDEITVEIVYDLEPLDAINLGDSIMIIAKGYSNAIEPLKECVQMMVDTSWMAGHTPSYPASMEWAELSDTLQENNRIFRRVFGLTSPVDIDSSGDGVCPVNFLVEAWDNACNHDTLRGEICKDMDLDPPEAAVLYEWHTDYDTMWACMSLGDKVLIRATLSDDDIVSVTAMMDSAGIDALMQHAMPLPDRGSGVWDTIWTITEPPIVYGKDRDNTEWPPRDSIYRAWVVACDDGGNCDTAYGDLNKTLDTRRPRPIGYSQFCPDSVPCALVANSMAGGVIEVEWDTACDENDAYAFYVWALAPGETEFDSIGFTSSDEQLGKYWSWHSEPLEEGYWRFKIKTEDNCSNIGDFSCEVGAYADATPPHVCIAVPDSGLTFGSWFPLKAVADSVSHDVDSAMLYYRLRPDVENPLLDPGAWTRCLSYPTMSRPGDGIVFLDTVQCLHGMIYTGWVELLVVACDEVGNCTDTTPEFVDEACVVDDDVFRLGHFLFYWDTLAPGVQLVSVNGFISPQSACGFDVDPDTMNEVVIDVEGATAADSFELEVRGLCSGEECRILHQDFVTMPCTIWVSVDGWPEGTQNLYVYVKDYDNGKTGNMQVELCVPPPPPEDCIYISWPHEWMRIPCTGTSGYNCVQITAQMYDYDQCKGVLFTEARFQWSPNGIDSWETIEDVIGTGPSWSTCWDNTGLVNHGDTVYFRVIAHDEFYMADTSHRVKVFVDCEQPNVKLRIEELYYTCGNHDMPKIPCSPLVLKAVLEDTLIDIDRIRFFIKRHSVPDIHEYWIPIDGWAQPAWSDNIWMYYWEEPCCTLEEISSGGGPLLREDCVWPNDYWDIRIAARDIAGQYMFDFDNDGFFDDSTFDDAVAFGSGITVYVDDEAPKPAISLVCDQGQEPPICVVNPSYSLGGTGKAFVQAGNDIYVEISPLPSEDTCEVMKVHYFLYIFGEWVHVGTSFDPYHYPITFNPVADGLIRADWLKDFGHWVGDLRAELHDSLGNTEEDTIDLYILDATPSQAVIIDPLNDSYVSGDVTLRVAIMNQAEVCKVCYEYRPADCPFDEDTCWHPVNGGYANACVYWDGYGDGGSAGAGAAFPLFPDFQLTWYTLNTVPDGEYYLRAVATDCDNNVDDDPPTIKVTVANEVPTVVIEDPRICERTCPDDTVDTLGYVSGKVQLFATASSIVPIEYVKFWCKDVYHPGYFYTEIGRDYFPTNGKYSVEWLTCGLPDGRYFLKAEVHNAAGKWGESEPVMITVDNSPPFVDIISVNGNDYYPGDVVDISLYDTLAVGVVAIDSTSNEGWTRCYNSGVTLLGFLVGDGTVFSNPGSDPPLSQLNWYTDFHDGDTLIYWNVSGLTPGNYWVYVVAQDCLGNWWFDMCQIHVFDYTPPMATVGGFYHNVCQDQDYIYGYTCDEDLMSAKFEYRKIVNGDTSAWLGVAEPDFFDEVSGQSTKHCYPGDCCCYRRFIQWVWNASTSLKESGDSISYQGRILATDFWGNNSEDSANVYAPIVNFTYENGKIIPDPGPLGPMSFEKNFMVGRMHGIVKQNSNDGDEPQMFGLYVPDPCGTSEIECVWMQQNLNDQTYFGGSFEAGIIHDGGTGTFFSSATVFEDEEIPQTGEGQAYTYLRSGDIMVVKVDRDLGTFTTYCTNFEPKWKEVCVYVPEGALDVPCDKHLVVWPQTMPPISIFQPTWIPIGDDEGYATYIGFTEDCNFACGGCGESPDGSSEILSGSGTSTDSSYYGEYCCFANGRYAKIKMNYSSEIDAPAESLVVAWWDNYQWKWSTDYVFWGSPYSEGFNTEEHYVEFATGCLFGPFAVIRLQERECEGTIVVDLYEIEPYCNGYTGPMPRFRTLINDNVQGTDHIYEQSMTFKIKKPGQPYMTIYDRGAGCDSCSWWAKGFGQYECGGWDPMTGILGVGWNDTMYFWTTYYSSDPPDLCPGCGFHHYANNMNWFNCNPAPGLAEGDSFFAQVYAENYSLHSCTRTVQFRVDATEPEMWFADSVGAYVGKNPHFCMYFTDEKAGVDKGSIWLDIYALESSNPSPSYHNPVATITPDMLHWMDDTTVCVDLTFEFDQGGYLHVFVYGGDECMCDTCSSLQYYYYRCGIADCVGNRKDVFWQYFTVDAYGPSITFRGADWCDLPLKFEITDALSGLQYVEVFEDSSQVESIEQDPHNSRYWYYTPSDGPHHVDLRAVDNLGNETVYSFDLTADCVPPVLTFIPGYVDCEDFTISFVLTDAGSGVVWDEVYLDLYRSSDYILTFAPEDLATMMSGDTVTVSVSGDDAAYLQLYNDARMYAVVYSAKNYGTSYTAGPADSAGNYYTNSNYFRQSYYADCSGPSISWKNTGVPKECDWPVLLSVTDSKSGVDEVLVYQDGVEQPSEALVYNPTTELWEYTPTTGMHTLDVVATDMVGNQTTYTFDVRDDCMGPVVSFADGYVTKNPTLQFVVSDQGSGVDWTTVNAWVSGCGEECVFQAPWIVENRNGDTVTLSGCHLDCNDGNEVVLYVYSGTYKTSKGPADLAGNYAPSYYMCSFVVDAYAPTISRSSLSERPIVITVADARSGVDWSTLEFFEDSVLVCEGLECEDTTVVIDTAKGRIEYMPPAGRLYVEIYIRDYAGNLKTYSFYTEEENLSFKNPYNYPNPFDPRETRTTIMPQTAKSAYVTVKLYDFAGEHVTTLWKDKWVGPYSALYWDGRTEDGTDVADGTYLCHIKARDNNGSVKTAVIKITVLKKD